MAGAANPASTRPLSALDLAIYRALVLTHHLAQFQIYKDLGIRFQAIVPLQIIGGTGVGDAAANAYARAMGMKPEEFLARFGVPLPPREFGEKVVSLLDDAKYAEGIAFGLKGDTGITVLEGAAA